MLSERFKLRLKYAYNMHTPTFFFGCFPSLFINNSQKKKRSNETKIKSNASKKRYGHTAAFKAITVTFLLG